MLRTATRSFLRLRHLPQHIRFNTHSRRIAHVEVERKFAPAREFRQKLKALLARQVTKPVGSPGFFWYAEKSTRIRDSYYDLHDQLASKGIWIRLRCTTPEEINSIAHSSPYTRRYWDAKVRIGGDYTKSKFMELQGEQQVRELLSEHMPGVMLDNLEMSADLETFRSTWTVHHHCASADSNEASSTPTDYLSVVLDQVSGASANHIRANCSEAFEHEVGEIEMTREVGGEWDAKEQSERTTMETERMDALIGTLIRENPELFAETKPVGKLSAYFDWKRRTGSPADRS